MPRMRRTYDDVYTHLDYKAELGNLSGIFPWTTVMSIFYTNDNILYNGKYLLYITHHANGKAIRTTEKLHRSIYEIRVTHAFSTPAEEGRHGLASCNLVIYTSESFIYNTDTQVSPYGNYQQFHATK